MNVPQTIIIVGCGVFGLSTGLALSQRYPNSTITLIDRYEPPVPDGTSTDTTRVIRADYHDPLYSKLAIEAQEKIKNDPDLKQFYFRSGMIYASAGPGQHLHRIWDKEYSAAKVLEGQRIQKGQFGKEGYVRDLFTHEELFKRVNGGEPTLEAGEKQWKKGYLNEDVAFVNAEECMRAYYHKLKRQSNVAFKFVPAKKLILEGNVAKGVELENGEVLKADLVILAAGPWSNVLLDLRDQVTVTGHEVAWLKLSPEMEKRYRNMPISTNFTTGFNSFPPLNGEIKILRRSPGYTNTRSITSEISGKNSYDTSVPPDTLSTIPKDAEEALRANLREIFPPLASQPFARTKLCWFTNTASSDFLIDRHPTISNLAIATGGSAHGWKFLCVLGDKVVDMLENKLQPELRLRWKFRDPNSQVKNMEGAPRAKGERQELKYCKRIAIVGAGVFGLASALHLVRSGYKDVTLFDYQPYHENGYACSKGCDAASADENKILRASYGEKKLYQDMAFKAMKSWEEWNEQVKTCTELPVGVERGDRLWENCGFLRVGDLFAEHEIQTQANFPEEIRYTQYMLSDGKRMEDAMRDGIPATKLDPFGRKERGLKTGGVFDNTAGYVLASKACSWMLHLCQEAGVNLKLGDCGRFEELVERDGKVVGLQTTDGVTHSADLVIVAAGGWTPSLVGEADQLLETTAGSVLTVQIPRNRQDLWDKFNPKNFPVWSWKMAGYSQSGTSTGGLYGFPRTSDGLIKFGFRGAKWTNYAFKSNSGRIISYPKTDVQTIPTRAMDVIQEFCKENMPELLTLSIQKRRLCWYTDSVDNNFVIDYVPGKRGLMVASGGSGHGFKFLPVLGKHVVDAVEGKDTPYTRLFKWREVPRDKRNGLEEGPGGWRTLDKQQTARTWKL
jgi:sarcosine oxidase/L-pipecolate oxidase